MKFNPNHDPTNGQFTFAGAGGEGGKRAGDAPDGQRRTAPGNARTSADPRHPSNYRLHTVRPGDTRQHIAATRVGITPADLRWLNQMKDDRLTVEQQIKVPTQESLDAGKRAFDTLVALDTYTSQHGGRLPPNAAHPPSLAQQVFGEGTTHPRRTATPMRSTHRAEPAS